jgi:pilus assembly protein CpaC
MMTQPTRRSLRPQSISWAILFLLIATTVWAEDPAPPSGGPPGVRLAIPEPTPVSTLPQAAADSSLPGAGQPLPQKSIVYTIRDANEHLEMVVNTSRILTMGQKIPQVQVNNPDLLEPLVLSPTEVQISAKKPGVTQVNLWGEDKKIYTIDVIVQGDARELTMLLQREFPGSAVRVTPLANGVLLSGYVDHPQNITRIRELAEEFYPKVLNNMVVGGVQQVLLHVQLMEVSRTKLRTLGFDFAKITNGNLVYSAISGLISNTSASGVPSVAAATGTFGFGIATANSAFFGVLNALRQDDLLKILAEPTLVTISGRAAFFHAGGEYPILVPQSLGTVSIDYKKFGTQVDFVPIVLGNGRIHLDVRPSVSELDPSINVVINNTTVPGLRTRTVETGVEMTAGQTLAIAGLIQRQDEAENKGLPWVSEVPYIGALFRQVQHQTNEIELLILVTPEVVEAMDASQVPPCGPGSNTATPDDVDLYLRGHLEVPNCCPKVANRPIQTGDGPGMVGGAEYQSPAPPASAAKPDASVKLQMVTVGGGLHDTPAPPQPDGGNAPPQNRPAPPKPQSGFPPATAAGANREPSFIGPVGYDVK